MCGVLAFVFVLCLVNHLVSCFFCVFVEYYGSCVLCDCDSCGLDVVVFRLSTCLRHVGDGFLGRHDRAQPSHAGDAVPRSGPFF